MSNLSELPNFVRRAAAAAAWDKAEAKRREAESKAAWDEYFAVCRERRKAAWANLPESLPSWMRPMAPGDYIRGRRVTSERESFEEVADKLKKGTK